MLNTQQQLLQAFLLNPRPLGKGGGWALEVQVSKIKSPLCHLQAIEPQLGDLISPSCLSNSDDYNSFLKGLRGRLNEMVYIP